jgi:CRISPR/Cas system CSM-associated protein Csm5 (group 7 of RAMP superfamily)
MNELFNNQRNLNKEEHKYELKDKPDFEFISVTTFIDTFFEEFDAQRIAKKLVKSSMNYMGMKVEDVLQQWKNTNKFKIWFILKLILMFFFV